MERASGALLLKAAATEIAVRGTRWRILYLQNIENEMSDQALINLVRNALEALRHAPAGQIALSGCREADGRIAIDVSETPGGRSHRPPPVLR